MVVYKNRLNINFLKIKHEIENMKMSIVKWFYRYEFTTVSFFFVISEYF